VRNVLWEERGCEDLISEIAKEQEPDSQGKDESASEGKYKEKEIGSGTVISGLCR